MVGSCRMLNLRPSSWRSPRADPSGIEAFASTPDGQGAVVLFVSLPNPDGSRAVVNVCLRLAGDVRDGFAEMRSSRAELEGMMRDLGTGGAIELAPAPPGEVVQLVDEAVARTLAAGSAIPRDARRSIEIIERFPRTPPPPLAPGRSLSMEAVVALLERPMHAAWFFDLADLVRCGVKPKLAGTSSAWMTDALKALARSPMRERVVAMARYMSRWSSWRGDPRAAGEWTTLAEGAERSFAECPLALAMIMKSMLGDKTKEVARKLAQPGGSPPGLKSFAGIFPEVAARETRTIVLDPRAGADAYELHEFYCVDPACDCRRVLFQAFSRARRDYVATIGHGFSAKQARRAGMEQTYLDPLHPSAPDAGELLAAVESLLRTDAAWHQRLEDHYAMVKRSVAKPVEAPTPGPKVGPNEPCPCGSGKKYKKCCRR
jgi:hypothetical protein